MKTSLFNRLLDPSTLAGLGDEELASIDRLLKEEQYDRIDARCALANLDEKGWARTDSGPLYWLQNHTKTIDDHAVAKGTPSKAPFPRKSYFQVLMAELLHPVMNPSTDCYTTLFPKSRELMTSWTICGYLSWLCQYRPGTTGVVQTLKETKAAELIRYVSVLQENQEPLLQERHRVSRSVALEIEWENGSRLFGIPGGEHQIRMFHPFVAVFDEMAFMEDAEACFNAVRPVAKQIVGVSSAHPGWMADQCSDVGSTAPSLPETLSKLEKAPYPYPIDRQNC
jgi:hypothetical protein